MSKRKAEAAPSVVINHINNIHNYFAAKDGPAPAPDAPEGPANLFPNDERRNYKYTKASGRNLSRPVLVSAAKPDGTLQGGCFNCTKTFLPMERFAPMECNNNGRKRPNFYKAVDDYDAAYAARDLDKAREARGRVEALRSGLCPPCVEANNKLSPAHQACKDETVRMRKEACARQGGCRYPNCVERGPQAWCVLEGDHVHTASDPDEELRKTYALSDYKWWSGHGGVSGMRAEAAKGLNFPCRFCHSLEPTSSAANKYEDPSSMPDGKRSGTREEVAQYNRKRQATIVYPKQQFVDAVKRDMMSCELCERPVIAGEEHAFIFDHRDAATKMIGKDTLAGENGGVAGLVNNCAKAATLDKIKDVLVNEMDLCRLLCTNCDPRQTHGYPTRV